MGADIKIEDSILNSTKQLLGLGEGYDVFDPNIIMHINTVFSNMKQMGIGPEEGFIVKDKNDLWDDYIKDRHSSLQSIKDYVYMKVRIMFDPPANGNLLESLNKTATELEYRIYIEEGGH